MVFHSYLESMLENEFVEVKDIIARHDTLAATNAELLERSRKAQERTEADRQAFAISSEVGRLILIKGKKQHDFKL
jgi:hypothetical protein